MPFPKLPEIQGETVAELVESMQKQRKEMQWLLQSLDTMNVKELNAAVVNAGVLNAERVAIGSSSTYEPGYNPDGLRTEMNNRFEVTDEEFTSQIATVTSAVNGAQGSADAANALLADLANDNKLTGVEKQETKKQWDIIVAEKPTISAQATTYGVTTELTNFNNSYTTLATYLTPLLADLASTSDIVAGTFRTNFKDYFDKKAILIKITAESARTLANTAQTAANTAQTTANTAQTAANTAQTAANTANTLLSDIANDDKITPTEKQDTKKEWDIIVSEKVTIDAQATTYAITTEKTTYGNAYTALSNYITPILSSLTTTTDIVGTTFRTTFKTYYDARTALLKKISDLAKSLADTAQGTANTANATANTLRDTTVPALAGRVSTAESTITQHATDISLRVTQTDVNTTVANDKQIKDTRSTNENPQYYWTNYPRRSVEEFKQRTVIGVTGVATYGNLTTEVPWSDSSGGSIIQTYVSSDGTFERRSTSTTAWSAWVQLESTAGAQAKVDLLNTNVVAPLTTRVSTAETKITPAAIVSTVTSSTTYTNDLGAKVGTSTIISSINQTAEVIKISASKIDINGAVTFSSFDSTTKGILSNSNGAIINDNPNFLDWSGTNPAGYSQTAVTGLTKVASGNGMGNAVQYVVGAGGNHYLNPTQVTTHPYYQYLVVDFIFNLTSGTIDGAGVLARYEATADIDNLISIKSIVSAPVLNKWYTITKTIKVASATPTAGFTGYSIYPMGGYTGFGTVTAKTIQFDSLKVRPATEQEINAYETGVNVVSKEATWDRAGNINSNGTFNTTKLSGTVSDAQVASGTAWNTAKDDTIRWKMAGKTTINGGLIETDTVTANQIYVATLDALSANLGNIIAGNITGVTLNLAGGKFVVDASGNVTFAGALNGATGTFAGKVTASNLVISDTASDTSQITLETAGGTSYGYATLSSSSTGGTMPLRIQLGSKSASGFSTAIGNALEIQLLAANVLLNGNTIVELDLRVNGALNPQNNITLLAGKQLNWASYGGVINMLDSTWIRFNKGLLVTGTVDATSVTVDTLLNFATYGGQITQSDTSWIRFNKGITTASNPINTTGLISGGSATITNTVTAGTFTTTGAVNAGSLAVTNGITAATVTTTGEILSGNVRMDGLNGIQNPNNLLYMRGEGGVDIRGWKAGVNTADINLGDDGTPRIWSMAAYNRTYAATANLTITSAGTFGRITSASKYKLSIEPINTDNYAERILELKPKSWYDKFATEQYADYLTKEMNGEDVNLTKIDIPVVKRYNGLIAEDLVEVGLSEYVTYGEVKEDGTQEIEGLEYDRLWTLLIPIVKGLKERVEVLEAQ